MQFLLRLEAERLADRGSQADNFFVALKSRNYGAENHPF
jgi:hypothetical protein